MPTVNTSPRTLELFLEKRPVPWSQVIALRSALRVLPLMGRNPADQYLFRAVFRSVLISWAALTRPALKIDSGLTSIAAAGASEYGFVGAFAAVRAAMIAGADYTPPADYMPPFGTGSEFHAGVAAAATEAAAIYVPDEWREIDFDIAMLLRIENGPKIQNGPEFLLRWPLWTGDEPAAVERDRIALFSAMIAADSNAYIWRDWYHRRLQGATSSWVLEQQADDAITLRLVQQDNAFWQRDFSAINADIAAWIAEAELPEPEPQNPVAPIFVTDTQGRITIDPLAGNDAIQRDDEAIDRHAEARDSADKAKEACSGNAAAAIRDLAQRYRDALGDALDTLRPGQLIPRGEALRQELAVRELSDPDSDRPPIPDSALLALRALVATHNLLVGLDPALAQRDLAMLGPDAVLTQVSRELARSIASSALQAGVLTALGSGAIVEAALVAPQVADPASRQSRLLTETIRNFGRKVFSMLKWGTGVGATVYTLGHWALANEAWLLQIFAGNTRMLEVARHIFEMLKRLPLH
ncbi:MAG: hypothetical protein ACKVOP_00625 [Sphingomonadaceae bacterium]